MACMQTCNEKREYPRRENMPRPTTTTTNTKHNDQHQQEPEQKTDATTTARTTSTAQARCGHFREPKARPHSWQENGHTQTRRTVPSSLGVSRFLVGIRAPKWDNFLESHIQSSGTKP